MWYKELYAPTDPVDVKVTSKQHWLVKNDAILPLKSHNDTLFSIKL